MSLESGKNNVELTEEEKLHITINLAMGLIERDSELKIAQI